MSTKIPVDVSSSAATLQSAMNRLIEDWKDVEHLGADVLLKIAQIQALLQIQEELYYIRMQRRGGGLPQVF